jgi:YegS C-terminal NAD kinase beta sandwich-like domain
VSDAGIRKGAAWGRPASGRCDLTVAGADADLAAAAQSRPGSSIWWQPTPGADLARALGLVTTSRPGPTEVTLDALVLDAAGFDPGSFAVNMLVLGTAPDRLRRRSLSRSVHVEIDGRPLFGGSATTVVVANGEFLRDADLIPRGHPGDGRVEVQVYAMRAGERRAMRSRLPQGVHLPHPRITTGSGRTVLVSVAGGFPLEVDGVACGAVNGLRLHVEPGALRLRL